MSAAMEPRQEGDAKMMTTQAPTIIDLHRNHETRMTYGAARDLVEMLTEQESDGLVYEATQADGAGAYYVVTVYDEDGIQIGTL